MAATFVTLGLSAPDQFLSDSSSDNKKTYFETNLNFGVSASLTLGIPVLTATLIRSMRINFFNMTLKNVIIEKKTKLRLQTKLGQVFDIDVPVPFISLNEYFSIGILNTNLNGTISLNNYLNGGRTFLLHNGNVNQGKNNFLIDENFKLNKENFLTLYMNITSLAGNTDVEFVSQSILELYNLSNLKYNVRSMTNNYHIKIMMEYQ